MKTDISRSTFDSRKNYSGVRMQQGRVLVDADWNEQLDIQRFSERQVRADIIGRAGVPREDINLAAGDPGGFSIAPTESGGALSVSPGRIYVDGILCESQDGAGEVDPLGLKSANPGSPDAPAGVYLVYLDVWERAVHATEDPSIVDPALLVPDTAARSKIEWRLGALPWKSTDADFPAPGDCEDLLDGLRRSDAAMPRLGASVDPGALADGPCIVPAMAGYRGIENQLYRVEIHRGNQADATIKPTLKWSRENAAVVFAIESWSGLTVQLRDQGIDEKFSLGGGDLVEIVSVEREARGELSGPMARVERKPEEGPHAFKLEVLDHPAVYNKLAAAFQPGDAVYLRRWDHGVAAALDGGGVAIEEGAAIALEHGVQVRFEVGAHSYRTGDYWWVAARAANDRHGSGELLWPADPSDSAKPQFRPPEGIQHHYAPLNFVRVLADDGYRYALLENPEDETNFDCRKTFPPLSDIHADEVRFETGACQRIVNATNVQQAIDELCQNIHAGCEFVIHPERAWQQELAEFVKGRRAIHICVPPKTISLGAPIRFTGMEIVRISGAGRASLLDAGGGDAALIFENCRRVEVRDLAVRAGVEPNASKIAVKSNLPQGKGALRFLECAEVEVHDIFVGCAGHWQERTCCLYARAAQESAGGSESALNVTGCELRVGHRQQGIVAINMGRFLAQNNRIHVDRNDPAAAFELLANNASQRKQFIDRFFQAPTRKQHLNKDPSYQHLSVNAHQVGFQSDPTIPGGWEYFIAAAQPGDIDSRDDLLEFAKISLDTILFASKLRPKSAKIGAIHKRLLGEKSEILSRSKMPSKTVNAWQRWAKDVKNAVDRRAYGMGGIVVAGQKSRRVRVVQNDVEGFVCGVHIGLSDDKAKFYARNILVRDNFIEAQIPYGYNRERHAIFVGNFDTLAIDDNRLTLEQAHPNFPKEVDGIRIFGSPGSHLTIKGNAAIEFQPGIHTVFLDSARDISSHTAWAVIDNSAAVQLMRRVIRKSGGVEEVIDSRFESLGKGNFRLDY